MSEQSADGDAQTVLRWNAARGWQHRIQVYQKPGSAHWAVVKDSRGPGGSWSRDWGTEAISRPLFGDPVDEVPSDQEKAHE